MSGFMFVFTKNRFGDYVLSREARLTPGATILVYRGYSSSVQQHNWSKKSVCAANKKLKMSFM